MSGATVALYLTAILCAFFAFAGARDIALAFAVIMNVWGAAVIILGEIRRGR